MGSKLPQPAPKEQTGHNGPPKSAPSLPQVPPNHGLSGRRFPLSPPPPPKKRNMVTCHGFKIALQEIVRQ